MTTDILRSLPESQLKQQLKNSYKNKDVLTSSDLRFLKDLETLDYALLGIIGLLINNKARILLGKKQSYDIDIQGWCNQIETTEKDLELIAEKYLEDDYSDESEFILRKVIIEYPKK